MTKKIITFLILGIVFTGIGYAVSVSAQENGYTLLAPLQDLKTVSGTNPLGEYVEFIFKMLIGLAVVAAVLNIVIGGFLYMSTDAIQGKSQGRERIKNAIIALVLIISAWLILYTINPNLLNINLNIQPAVTTAPAVTGVILGYALTPEQIQQEAIIRSNLSAGVTVNAGPCVSGETSGCTNLSGLPQNVWTGLISLQSACSSVSGSLCNLRITAGSEGGHTSHGPGVATIDLAKNSALDSFIKTGRTPNQSQWGPIYTVTIDGRTINFLEESADAPGSTGAHWHVAF